MSEKTIFEHFRIITGVDTYVHVYGLDAKCSLFLYYVEQEIFTFRAKNAFFPRSILKLQNLVTKRRESCDITCFLLV